MGGERGRLERILAPGAHEPAVLLALKARAVEESLPDLRVMAVAHRRHHVPAIVAKMLDRFLPGDVSLVRHQDREDEDQGANDHANHPALEAPFVLERERGPREGHATPCRLLVQILNGGNIGG